MAGKIIECVEGAAQAPGRGHPVHEYPEEPLKEVHEPPYRIIYAVSGSEFHVVTIVHFKQRLRRKALPPRVRARRSEGSEKK
jgi:plasmid stabilization system protein ParE